MDDENRRNQAKTDPVTQSICSWSHSQNSDSIANTYYFGNTGGGGVRHTNLFSDFGWNLPLLQADERHEYGDFDQMAGNNHPTNPTASASTVSASDGGGGSEVERQLMVSTSSSEDKAEKSTASGGSTSRPPSETANKVKKKGQKRIRQPRFAFITKSEVDHLEDGYRWRKYGQKAVKNSPYPRSYYRCTNTKCTVKKRVERSSEDPTTVITTYEGQHCHHTVGFPRNTSLIINPEITFPTPFISTTSPQIYYPLSPPPPSLGLMHFSQDSAPVNISQTFRYTGEGGGDRSESFRYTGEGRDSHSLPASTTDEGLLGDIVPHGMRNS